MKTIIGIRMVNDGRDSVRYKIEEKCRQMAAQAKKIIQENVFDLAGKPIEVVISKTTITNAAEASAVDEEFARLGVTGSLSVIPIFCFGTETMDLNPHTIKAVWGTNCTERPGAVYLACIMSAYAERGLPAFSIYGKEVQDMDDDTVTDDVKEKLICYAKVVNAVAQMRNKSYVAIGNVSMGIPGSLLDPMLLQEYLGMRAEWVDMTEVLRRIKKNIFDEKEYEIAAKWVKKNIKQGEDFYNPKELRHTAEEYKKDWEYSIKMAIIIKDIMYGNKKLADKGYYEESLGKNALVGGFQGQRQWTDWLPNCDFAESIINTSFDWSGIKQPTPFATENDTLNGLTMMFGTLLTNKATIFADVRTYWSNESVKRVTGKELMGKAKNGIIHLNNSGAAALDGAGEMKEKGKPAIKEWWKVTDQDIKNTLKAVTYHPANLEYFKGGGMSSHYVTRAELPVTMMRLNKVKGIGPVLQIVEGHTVDLPRDITDPIEKRTDRAWPSTFFAPRVSGDGNVKDVYSIMANWGANHCALVSGHIGTEALALASALRIPVSLHNIEKERIFRPHVWAYYGESDNVASDILACRDLGPLYK